ncbi:hypothetical protein M9Y10_045636 [Tritrichomonas musculus]|uniref:Cell cycle control protein 50A n=1 Tax=Tritrichomonas musculus TaxID=1915356 RepID=A0ABR2JVT7_9EUKA
MFPKGFKTALTDEHGAPMQTVFSQQRTEAWRPLFTPVIVILILFIFGIGLVGLGAFFYLISSKIIEIDYRYDDYCARNFPNSKFCELPIKIPKDIKDKVFILYRLTNFYQNHQRYVTSRCDAQLRGEYADFNDMSYCGDYRSINGDSKDNKYWLLPCGAIASSVFNDTFEFKVHNSTTSLQPQANFLSAGISWRSDREKLFKKLNSEYDGIGVHWLKNNETKDIFPKGQRNEHFIVWMRTSSLPTFMKPYAHCSNCFLPAAGNYSIIIENNYPTSLFNGEKHIVLSTVSALGGKNYALSISYMVVGSFLFISGLVVFVSHVFFPRKLGDSSYLSRPIARREKNYN